MSLFPWNLSTAAAGHSRTRRRAYNGKLTMACAFGPSSLIPLPWRGQASSTADQWPMRAGFREKQRRGGERSSSLSVSGVGLMTKVARACCDTARSTDALPTWSKRSSPDRASSSADFFATVEIALLVTGQ
jgi:hypothetical protein